MNLSILALGGVIVVAVLYCLMLLVGLIAAGPVSLFAIIPIGFVAFLFFSVLSDRLKSKEDDYYEKNIKD